MALIAHGRPSPVHAITSKTPCAYGSSGALRVAWRWHSLLDWHREQRGRSYFAQAVAAETSCAPARAADGSRAPSRLNDCEWAPAPRAALRCRARARRVRPPRRLASSPERRCCARGRAVARCARLRASAARSTPNMHAPPQGVAQDATDHARRRRRRAEAQWRYAITPITVGYAQPRAVRVVAREKDATGELRRRSRDGFRSSAG